MGKSGQNRAGANPSLEFVGRHDPSPPAAIKVKNFKRNARAFQNKQRI